MGIQELLRHFDREKIRFVISDEKLRLSGPKGALTPPVIAAAARHRDRLMVIAREATRAIDELIGDCREARVKFAAAIEHDDKLCLWTDDERPISAKLKKKIEKSKKSLIALCKALGPPFVTTSTCCICGKDYNVKGCEIILCPDCQRRIPQQ